ncbi:MAG: hypothetical protein ACK5P7_10960 [Bdellovibrio sp.]|jgi:hypothetical protein
MKKTILVLGFLTAANLAWAKTIADVKVAKCTGASGSFIEANVNSQVIRGKLGTLKELSSMPGKTPFAVTKGYPLADHTSLGGLALDKTGYWGNLSLISLTNKELGTKDKLTGFFTDMNGRAQTEELLCDLTF